MARTNNQIEKRMPAGGSEESKLDMKEFIRLAEEKNDPEQVIINISPDIFEQLQQEFEAMKDSGYSGSYQDFLYSKIRITKADGGLISNYKIALRKP